VPREAPQIALDRQRLDAVKEARAEAAAAYFRANAAQWDSIRSLYVSEAEVEAALIDLLPPGSVGDLLDIGTGTGRILSLYGSTATRAVGIDLSRDMLAVARANLETAGQRNCHVRQASMYQLPFDAHAFDAVTIHQVLHYADRPRSVIAEAARVVKPGGRLLIVDFAPHALEFLRERHAHRRLGFAPGEVEDWSASNGLAVRATRRLPGTQLTVMLWLLERDEAARGRDAAMPGPRAVETVG